jgi:sec-independent protein translocase protein TatC
VSDTVETRRRRLRLRLRRKQRRREVAMSVVDHLSELRSRIIVSLVAFVGLSIAAFFFYGPLLDLLTKPLCQVPEKLLGPTGCQLNVIGVTEGFQFRLKLTALAGLAVASPVWVYELYSFIVPALTPKEKRYSIPFLLSSVTLFVLGFVFAYVTLPRGVEFLIALGGQGLNPILTAEKYLNFVGLVLIAFGVTFQLPLLLIFLGLVGAISVEQLRRNRKLALVGIFALSAVVTPSQDPYTMSIMAVPLYGLYEVTIVILKRLKKVPKET